MIILGLTGSIAQGKSATAHMFRQLGVPVFDADAAVHRAYASGGVAVPAIQACYPDVIRAGAVDRALLAAKVMADPAVLPDIEHIVHPLIAASRHRLFLTASRQHKPYVVMDVPLLYETRGFLLCDAVCVVTAPAWLQRQRALSRPGMTDEKFQYILQKQVPDRIKRRLARHVITTGQGFAQARRQVHKVDRHLRRQMKGRHRWQHGGIKPRPLTGQEQLFLRRPRHA